MTYVLTGGAGHITKPLAERLLAAGHEVTLVGRSAENLKPLTDKGAKAAVGSVEDTAFLTETFKGADAVYTVVPPHFGAGDWKGWIAQIGKNYAEAVRGAGVKYVVNLSSVGAHMSDGAGPVSGLHRVEESLNALDGVNVKHLRPGYFYYNFFANIGMIKGANLFGGNVARADTKMIMAHPADIAEAAAEELLNPSFTGRSVRYVASDERTAEDIAKAFGAAVGKPGLQWTEFGDEEALNGMKGAGLPEEVAKNYAEMGHALRTGAMSEDYWKHRPQQLGKTKLEAFTKEFAAAYNAS